MLISLLESPHGLRFKKHVRIFVRKDNNDLSKKKERKNTKKKRKGRATFSHVPTD